MCDPFLHDDDFFGPQFHTYVWVRKGEGDSLEITAVAAMPYVDVKLFEKGLLRHIRPSTIVGEPEKAVLRAGGELLLEMWDCDDVPLPPISTSWSDEYDAVTYFFRRDQFGYPCFRFRRKPYHLIHALGADLCAKIKEHFG